MYNDKYVKAKMNLYDTNVYGNKTAIEGENFTCFSVDSIIDVDKKHYPQIFLKSKIFFYSLNIYKYFKLLNIW